MYLFIIEMRVISVGNLETKKVCIIGDSQWGQKLMEVAYEMGVLGGVVESNLKKYMVLLKSYPGIILYTHIERAINEGYDNYVVDVSDENKFDIVRYLLNNKKNVFIKKVLAVASGNISELIEISKSTGSKIMFGNTLEFYQVIEKVKDTVSREQIGEIEGIFSYRFDNSISSRYSDNLLFSIKEETVLINQLNELNSEPLEKIYSYKNIDTPNDMVEKTYLSPKYSNNLLQHFFISFRTTFSNFKMLIIGNKGLVIIEDINGNYKLTTHCRKCNRLAYRIWLPSKKTKTINCLLKEELQVFLDHIGSI